MTTIQNTILIQFQCNLNQLFSQNHECITLYTSHDFNHWEAFYIHVSYSDKILFYYISIQNI